MRDAALDLLLGSACEVCGRPGRALCPPCWAAVGPDPRLRWPSPSPSGLAPPWSAGVYDGAVRALVLAHKERARLSLARPLGALLAGAVEAAVSGVGRECGRVTAPGEVWEIVPVPSHPSVVRARGHDPMGRIARRAASDLRARGIRARLGRALVVTGRPRDQSGLDAAARAANLAGTFAARAGVPLRGPVVVVDDVLTTGATAREAQRALEQDGAQVAAVAVVAATRRRVPTDVGPVAGAT